MNLRPASSLLVLVFVVGMTSPVRAESQPVDFTRDIRPILADRCFECHGPAEKHREGNLRLDLATGKFGAYRTHEGRTAIAPKDLKKSELWQRIISGDADIRMPPADSKKKPLTTKERDLIKRWILQGAPYAKFWAFEPPQRTPTPTPADKSWRSGYIDPYVKARLEQKGWQPKNEADKRTLIRRVTFDLTGLPPTLPEIERFLKDDSPQAYDRLVDRLLKSPTYGEHMARYWADAVRLADTNGMHKDFYRNFSTYRSWLIRSFNTNLSFDKFLTYQLAGDLYPKPTQDQLIASGFNRLHLIIDRGTALPEESRHKNVLDRVEAFGTVFLGLTVQCAQCHSHKYDPVSQKEFYQLYAFFNNFDGAPETGFRPRGGIQAPYIKLNDSPGKLAMVMKERKTPRKTHVLIRGDYDKPGEEVQRNTPAFLPPLKRKGGIATRMDLARWLIDARHPLTARVTVNRFWQQFFGVGLVKTSHDFGTRGEFPSHPKLLDRLALEFTGSGWDVKKLIRAIVLSKTYRQSSNADAGEYQRDPENRMLARGARYRMDAEMIRDQILLLSGKLNRTMHGESVKPPQPPGLWKAVSMTAPFTYVADKGDAVYRRSFYTYWRRGMPPPQMTIMNAPSREFCTVRRERTNTPLQALLLMNEQEYFKAARSFAALTRKETKNDEAKGLIRLYEKTTSHRPDADRLKMMRSALAGFRAIYANDNKLVAEITPGMTNLEHKQRVELAAWTMLAHSLLNLEVAKVKR